MFCENCGSENPNGAKFCKNCGQPIVDHFRQDKDVFCENCGTKNPDSFKFCENCGHQFGKSVKDDEPLIKKEDSRPIVLAGNELFFPPAMDMSGNSFSPLAVDFLEEQKEGHSDAPDRSILSEGRKKIQSLTKIQKRIGVSVVIVLALSIGGLSYASYLSSQKTSLTDAFNSAASGIKQLGSSISEKSKQGKDLLSSTDKKDVADPGLLKQLQSKIDSAKDVSVVVPGIAADSDAIRQQTQELTVKKNDLQKQFDDLTSAISAVNASKQKLKDDKLQEAITLKDSHSITVTDNNGNKEKITIKIGKWIRGSDTDFLDRAWKSVGGDGPNPLAGDSSLVSREFQPKTAAYVFGTVSVENKTPDFDAKNFNNGNSSVKLSLGIRDGSLSSGVFWCRQYAKGSDCNGSGASYEPLIEPDMKSNSWGPVPFVVGVGNVFTPNFPKGNPALTDAHFTLSSIAASFSFRDNTEGDKDFKVDKSW